MCSDHVTPVIQRLTNRCTLWLKYKSYMLTFQPAGQKKLTKGNILYLRKIIFAELCVSLSHDLLFFLFTLCLFTFLFCW